MNQDQQLRETILKYIRGEMSHSEAHAFEKAMLEDPFLADAVEGLQLEFDALKTSLELNDLDKKLNPAGGQKYRMPFFQMAAVLLILVGTGLVIWLRMQQTDKVEMAIQNIPESTTEMGKDSKNTNPENIQESSQPIAAQNSVVPQTEEAPEETKTVLAEKQYFDPESNQKIVASEIAMDQAISEDASFSNAGIAAPESEDLRTNPDVAEQLLAWADEFNKNNTEQLSLTQTATIQSKKESNKSKRKGEAEPAPATAGAAQTEKVQIASNPAQVNQLIRNGKLKEAEQELNQAEKNQPGWPVWAILRAALELKKGNKSNALNSLKTLKGGIHAQRAAQFEKNIR